MGSYETNVSFSPDVSLRQGVGVLVKNAGSDSTVWGRPQKLMLLVPSLHF